jgi:hypothetical protein
MNPSPVPGQPEKLATGSGDRDSPERKFREWHRKMSEQLTCNGQKGIAPARRDCTFKAPIKRWEIANTWLTSTIDDGKIEWKGITVVLSCPECGTRREVTFDFSDALK